MKKLLIILYIFIILGCKSKEERIVKYFELELQKTNLKIDTVDGLDIFIIPIKNSYESYTPNGYDLITIEDEDSLRLEIKKTVEHINKWFDLPNWEQAKGNIYPYISKKTEHISGTKYLLTELSNSSAFYYEHHNHETHRHHTVHQNDLVEWQKDKDAIKKIAFENLAKFYKSDSKLTTDTINNVRFLRIRSNNEILENPLLFIDNSQKELDSIIGHPYYATVSNEIPQFIFKPKDLEFFKEYISKIIETNKSIDSKVELVKFTEKGFEISRLE